MSSEKSDEHHPSPAPEPSEGPEGTSVDATVESESPAKPDDYWDPRGKSPDPKSGPCTCHCGGCCTHSTSSEPQHCVRCHANYTFNHSQACSVPHVFYSNDLRVPDISEDLAVRSMCCGSQVAAGVPLKCDWLQPFPCFIGWHTTDVDAVKEQYNGLNILRCNPNRAGKCRRARMKHHAYYGNLFDENIEYIEADKEDRESYLEKKGEELGDQYEDSFDYVEETLEEPFPTKRKKRRDVHY